MACFYYDSFDKISNEGHVFCQDFSSKAVPLNELTEQEVEERKAWNEKFDAIMKEY